MRNRRSSYPLIPEISYASPIYVVLRVIIQVMYRVPKPNLIIASVSVITGLFWLFWLVFNYSMHSEFEVGMDLVSYPPLIFESLGYLYFCKSDELMYIRMREVFKTLLMAWLIGCGVVFGVFDFIFAHWTSVYIETLARASDLFNTATGVFLFLQSPFSAKGD